MSTATTTLIITDDCPLNCRYCNLREDMDNSRENPCRYLPGLKDCIENIEAFIEKSAAANDYRIVLSGGEPFMRWNLIKDLLDYYKDNDRITWEFNTSGYLLTEDIIRHLTKYKVSWNLSVDGGLKVTRYLRPLRYAQGNYFDKLKQIAPCLLFWFPFVFCKVIVSKNTVSELYNSYLELERIGFKRMFLQLDLTEREDLHHKSPWTEEDYAKLYEQVEKIAEQRVKGMIYGVERMEIIQMEEIIQDLLTCNVKDLTEKSLVCGVCDGRIGASMMQGGGLQGNGSCYDSLGFTKQTLIKGLRDELDAIDRKCPIDPDCMIFGHCAKRGCVRDNYELRGGFYKQEDQFCKKALILGAAAMYFLEQCNTRCPDSLEYLHYLKLKGV